MTTATEPELTVAAQAMVEVWEQHVRSEFVDHSADAALETMSATPHLNHVPVMTGGVGRDEIHIETLTCRLRRGSITPIRAQAPSRSPTVIRRAARIASTISGVSSANPDSALLIASASAHAVTDVQTQALNSFVGSGPVLAPADLTAIIGVGCRR
jgi:hypothetical protein